MVINGHDGESFSFFYFFSKILIFGCSVAILGQNGRDNWQSRVLRFVLAINGRSRRV